MADIFDELIQGGAAPQELVNALRRQKAIGTVGALSGDRRVAGVGAAEAGSALEQAAGIRDSRERAQAREDQQAFARWQQEQASADRKAMRDYQYAALKQAGELGRLRTQSQGLSRSLSPFEKERQRKLGAEAADWETRGRPMAESNINLLTGALDDLKKDPKLADEFLPGLIPDNIRALYNQKGLDLQQRVAAVTVQNMREAFGAQFTEKENALFRALEYDPALSNEINRKRLEAKLAQIQRLSAARENSISRHTQTAEGADPVMLEAMSILGAQ